MYIIANIKIFQFVKVLILESHIFHFAGVSRISSRTVHVWKEHCKTHMQKKKTKQCLGQDSLTRILFAFDAMCFSILKGCAGEQC